MASLVDTMKESEIEELYHGMTDDDLQTLLLQEKCLNRRRILRKELRTRKHNPPSIGSVPTVQTKYNIEPSIQPSSRLETFASPNIMKGSKDKDIKECNPTHVIENKPSYDEPSEELEKLKKELHDTLDIDRRKVLRKKINNLQSDSQSRIVDKIVPTKKPNERTQNITKEITTKPETVTTPQQNSLNADVQSKANTFKESTMTIDDKETKINELLTPKIQPRQTSPSPSRDTYGRKDQVPETKATLDKPAVAVSVDNKSSSIKNVPFKKDYRSLKMTFFEADDIILKLGQADIGSPIVKMVWFFKDKLIEEYPKPYFPNLHYTKVDKDIVLLQFSNASINAHQGIYKLELKTNDVSWEISFDVTIDKKVATKEETKTITPSSTVVAKKVPLPNGIERRSIKSVSPLVIQPKSMDTKTTERVTSNETNINKNVNISRVASTRDKFEKKADATENTKQRKIGHSSPSGEELADLVNQYLSEPNDDAISRIGTSNKLEVPSQPARKNSQTLSAPDQVMPISRRRSSVKDMLLSWIRMNTELYQNVDIKNYSSSWADGLAFCALIHHFYPESFDYSQLNPANREHNFNLAFETASKYAGISPLLDTEDLIGVDNPDWKCVYTYVQLMYTTLKNHPRNTMTRNE